MLDRNIPVISMQNFSEAQFVVQFSAILNNVCYLLSQVPNANKTAIYVSGLNIMSETAVRNVVRKCFEKTPYFTARVTKTAGFDSVVKITVTKVPPPEITKYFSLGEIFNRSTLFIAQ